LSNETSVFLSVISYWKARYNRALGADIPPIGDAIVKGFVYSPKTSAQNTMNALIDMFSREGFVCVSRISKGAIRRARELHNFLESKPNPTRKNLLRFKELYSGLTSYLMIIVFAEKWLDSKVEELIKRKTGSLNKRYHRGLVYVRKYNQNTQELIDILKLCCDIQNLAPDSVKVKKKIADHTGKYAWLGSRWKLEPGWTESEITSRVKYHLKGNPNEQLKNVQQPRDEAEKITAEFIHKYKLSKDELDLIKFVKEFVYLRTFRTENMAKAAYLLRPVLQRIGKKYGYSIEELSDLTIDEIISLSEGKQDFHALSAKRKKEGYYMIIRDDKIWSFVGGEKKVIDETGLFQLPDTTDQTLKGQVAWKGLAKGTVKIIKKESDITKVKRGDILVAVMTFPNYIPAMERAAAFVTNEGGILCHAAIVSREMKKPCIIGTKIATRVLKDGDRVVVDADKGIVKKVN